MRRGRVARTVAATVTVIAAVPAVESHARTAPPAVVVHAAPSPGAIEMVRRARRLEARALRMDAAPARDTATGSGRDPFGAVLDRVAADSARALYDSAAVLVPAVREWFALRALALEPSEPRRTARAARLALPVTRERAARTDAIARARYGDAAEAARRLAASDPVSALQLRLRDTLPAVVDSVRRALVALAHAGGAVGARAADVANARWPTLAGDDRLAIARAMAGTAPRRALALLDTLRLAGGLGPGDRVLRATISARVGSALVAAQAWDDVARDAAPAVRRWALVQQGRALVRAGRDSDAVAVLARVVAQPDVDSATAHARWLLGDRAANADRPDEARAHFHAIGRDVPASPLAARGAYEGALLLVGIDDGRAAREFDRVADRWPSATEAVGARYWAGRSRAALGDTAGAAADWRRVVDLDAVGYHGLLAAQRLGRPLGGPIAGPTAGRRIRPSVAVGMAVDRMVLLEALGLMPEAALERAALVAAAGSDPTRLLEAAAALVESPRPGLGIALADRALQSGAPADAAALRLVHPLPYGALIRAEAARRRVDPALAAALIRQESRFTADAVSGAGARGLMQLMPATAAALARAEGRRWSPALLDDPAVNVALGMRHLAGELARWPAPAYALAAYNAGGTRVDRWRARRGHDDPELFTERIPFAETRDYVRTILRTRALYARLWGDHGLLDGTGD